MKILKVDHLGIAVKDLSEALRAYEALGFAVEATHDVPTEKVRAAFLPVGESHLELLEPTDPSSVIARFLEKRSGLHSGPPRAGGLHHVCVLVEDIDAALAELKARGVPLLDETPRPGAGGCRVAFVHPRGAAGVLLELKDADEHGRATDRDAEPDSLRRGGGGSGGRGAAAPSTMTPIEMGDARVHVLSDGTLALDGGAIFGVVPRVVWEKRDPPDERNRVTLGLNVALVESGGKRVLVDTGMGDRWGEKEVRMYRIDRSTTVLDGLRARGLGPEDVDVVVNTHLHFDHAGGNTRRERGRLVPAFPRARYVVQRGEWEDARRPHERSRASYREDDFLPLAESGRLDLIDGEVEVAPGVRAVPVGGHTTHLQMVMVEGGGETLVVPSDLLPTASHLPLPFVMGYDLFPVATLEAKRRLLAAVVEGGWRVLFYHDARTPVGRVRRAGDGYALEVTS